MILHELERLRRRGVKPGLERVRKILARLGNPERAFRVVLIGGSNGKGSTARALAEIMRADGKKVGLYTSPHLLRFSERIVLDGKEADESEIESALTDIWPLLTRFKATYFEAATVLALACFAKAGVELAVLEVGLGGRFDAVNVTEPELSIITNISLEHTDWLGATLKDIAREKAGIIRPGRLVLSSANGQAASFLAEIARSKGAVISFAVPSQVQVSGYGVDFSLERRRYHGSLMGRHQAKNLGLAVLAARRLGAGEKAVSNALARLTHPGRLSYYPSERLLCDGAHNPAGAAVLAQALRDYFPTSRKTLVFAVSKDKDVAAMVARLTPLFERVILTGFPGRRSRPPAELRRYFSGAALESDPAKALATAQTERADGGLTVAAGSLYLLAALARHRAGLAPEERSQ